MDPITALLIPLLLGLTVAAVRELVLRSPRLMNYFTSLFFGLDFLVVGPKEVGKTTFYRVLSNDQFADEFEVRPTFVVSAKKVLNVNKGKGLKLKIRSAFDIPGDLPPHRQVEEVKKRKPHVLLVFLSAGDAENETRKWLTSFLKSLANTLSHDKKFSAKIKYIGFVLNQVDRVSTKAATKRVKRIDADVKKGLKLVLGNNIKSAEVLKCSLLASKGGEKFTNQIIFAVVHAVKLKQRLVKK